MDSGGTAPECLSEFLFPSSSVTFPFLVIGSSTPHLRAGRLGIQSLPLRSHDVHELIPS